MPPNVLEGFAGTTKGSFFESPAWVDEKKAPGTTAQSKVYGSWSGVIRNYVTTGYFFYSPNLVWFVIALGTYILFPYDFKKAETWAVDWVALRLLVNMVVVYAYFGFWNVSLYVLGWGKRKFNADKNPTASRMFHNIWYSTLGVIQWTAWEVCFMHAYATGKLPYVSDAEVMSSPTEMAKFIGWCLFVPLWRDFHFYFAHRTLHLRFLYKYVHSLHHRNTDIEPFSGLCMHPIEHLYYFSCVGPSLYVHASPFMMMWNGIHLLISPAASHSGWEDHFQSDQFHYLHHVKFECNFGTSGPPLDKLFGTFRERLGKSTEYAGESKDMFEDATANKSVVKGNAFLSGTLRLSDAIPSRMDETVFNSLYLAVFAAFGLATVGHGQFAAKPYEMAFLLGFGPPLIGLLVLFAFGDKKSLLWPFHKEPIFGAMGFHTVIAFFMVILPVFHFGTTVLAPKGQAPYFKIFPVA